MTKHMYRIDFGPDAALTVDAANTWIKTWVSENDVWVGDTGESYVRVFDGTNDSTITVEYWRVMFRFHPIRDRTDLLFELNSVLQDNTSWFVVPYHVCEHDDRPIGDCSWDHLYYWPSIDAVPDGYISDLNDSVIDLHPADSTKVPTI